MALYSTVAPKTFHEKKKVFFAYVLQILEYYSFWTKIEKYLIYSIIMLEWLSNILNLPTIVDSASFYYQFWMYSTIRQVFN